MGIFFDRCAYCDNKVRKTARFCNHCGKPAPGGWWKCPACGKWIGNDSQFCPHCNAPLYPENRADLAGGVWQKERTRFAERFEVGDVGRLLSDGLLVQEGTEAVLLDAGHVCGILGPGRHDSPDPLGTGGWFSRSMSRSVVLVDVGEVAVPVKVEALRTAEGFPLEFYGEVIFRLTDGTDAAQKFISNMMKGGRTLEFSDIAARIQSLVRVAVSDFCAGADLDGLVRDPQRRIRLHDSMTETLKADFDACGLGIVRVSSAEFTGEVYEEYVEREARVDMERRRVERDAALRSLLNREDLAKCQDATELLRRKHAIDREFRLEELDAEFDEKTRRLRHERETDMLRQAWEEEDVLRAQRMEIDRTKHQAELQKLLAEVERQKKIGDAEAQVKIDKMLLEIRAIKDRMESERKTNDAARRKEMTVEQLLVDIDDPDKRSDLMELKRMQIQAGMTEKQILAMKGIVSTTDVFVEEMKRLYADSADRDERRLSKILEPVIEAVKRPGNGPNIYK